MLFNLIWFLCGMGVVLLYSYVMTLGYCVNVVMQTQQSCAAMFTVSEEGLQEVLELKYIAMHEAKRSEQNIKAQRHIDKTNIDSMKKSIMRNYVATFPKSYGHLMEYSSWNELEEYVNRFIQNNKGKYNG